MIQLTVTDEQINVLMWALGVARARASIEDMPDAAKAIWELTQQFISQHAAQQTKGG